MLVEYYDEYKAHHSYAPVKLTKQFEDWLRTNGVAFDDVHEHVYPFVSEMNVTKETRFNYTAFLKAFVRYCYERNGVSPKHIAWIDTHVWADSEEGIFPNTAPDSVLGQARRMVIHDDGSWEVLE